MSALKASVGIKFEIKIGICSTVWSVLSTFVLLNSLMPLPTVHAVFYVMWNFNFCTMYNKNVWSYCVCQSKVTVQVCWAFILKHKRGYNDYTLFNRELNCGIFFYTIQITCQNICHTELFHLSVGKILCPPFPFLLFKKKKKNLSF